MFLFVRCFKGQPPASTQHPSTAKHAVSEKSSGTADPPIGDGKGGDKGDKVEQETLPVPIQCQDRYSVIKYLNRGASGFVVLVRDAADDELKALKFINRRHDGYALREIINQVRIQHPHVIRLEEILATSEFIILVLEYAERGDLFTFLKGRRRFSEKRSRWYLQQLMFAVDFCHRLGIINRDIKLENLLLRGRNNEILKLGDFGLSKDESKSSLKSSVGTVLYLAPELITGYGEKAEYDGKKAEVWACGVVLYTMITGHYPFVRKGERELARVTLMTKILHRIVDRDYPEPEHVSEGLTDLLGHMLDPDPETRASVDDVLNHPWFRTGLRFDVREYNQQIIDRIKSDEKHHKGLEDAVEEFLSTWDKDSGSSSLEGEIFDLKLPLKARTLGSDEETPVRLASSAPSAANE